MFIWTTQDASGAEIVLYVVIGFIGCIAFALSFEGVRYRSYEYRDYVDAKKARGKHASPFGYARRNGLATIVVLYLIMVVVAGIASMPAKPLHKSSISEAQVTAMFGLQSDKAYPLVLGDKIDGSSGSAYAHGGFFSASAYATLQPASAITISFTTGDTSYILEIPTVKIKFVQSTTEQNVRLVITGDGTYDAHWVRKYSSCTFVFNNLLPGCHKRLLSEKIVLYGDAQRHGLAPIVQNSLDSATITLSPDTYKQLVGERN